MTYDPHAERHLLGLALFAPARIAEIAEHVDRTDFYLDRHRAIWDALTSVENPRRPLVLAALDRDGVKVGERDGEGQEANSVYLGRLIREAPTWDARGAVVASLIDARQRRDLVAIGQRLAAIGEQGTGEQSTIEYAADVFADLLTVTDRARVDDRRKTMRDWCGDLVDEMQENLRLAKDGHVLDLRCGVPDIDELIAFRPGRYIAIGARPGEGKSSLLRQALREFTVRHGERCALITLEMVEVDQVGAIIASECGVSSERIMSGQPLEEEDAARFTAAVGHDANRLLWVRQPRVPTWPAIERELEYLHRCHGLRAFGLDYLQLIATRRGTKRHEGLGEISRGIKHLCNRTGMTALVAAQLNRNVIGRPSLANFRECGDIEQDADAAILINRLETDDKSEVIVAKNRRGRTGVRTLRFNGARTRFESEDRFGA